MRHQYTRELFTDLNVVALALHFITPTQSVQLVLTTPIEMMSYLPEDLHCSRADMEVTSEIQPFCEEDGNRCMHIHCMYMYIYSVCICM